LAHHAQPVGLKTGQDVGVDGEGRLELGELERAFKTQQLNAVAQHVQGAALVELVAQAGKQRLSSLGAVVLGEHLPGLRLRRLHPGQHVGREQRAGAVIAGGIALGMEPTIGAQVLANFKLEADFFVQAHWPSLFVFFCGR
jgi:hypothetical protein